MPQNLFTDNISHQARGCRYGPVGSLVYATKFKYLPPLHLANVLHSLLVARGSFANHGARATFFFPISFARSHTCVRHSPCARGEHRCVSNRTLLRFPFFFPSLITPCNPAKTADVVFVQNQRRRYDFKEGNQIGVRWRVPIGWSEQALILMYLINSLCRLFGLLLDSKVNSH